ncbi:MAG: zf-TFIIB domain-containing protein [Candidatus Omnitrophica bacterium]|nr:zf-TFIIB domain-containing protein [Candidatus Omnitrophota bacterium]
MDSSHSVEVRATPFRSLACPKCKKPLQLILCHAVEVDTCPSCHGIWVDHPEEKQMLEIKPEAFTVAELRRLRKAYQRLSKRDPVRYAPCPVCLQLMHRVNWGSRSGVVVDRCEKHGTWYDEGEVDKIREYIRTGGVEFEKLRLTEGGLSELNSKLDREVTRLQTQINYKYMLARLYSMLGL